MTLLARLFTLVACIAGSMQIFAAGAQQPLSDDPAIRLMQQNMGKTLRSPGGDVVFDMAEDGRYRVVLWGATFLLRDIPGGPPEAKTHHPGTVKIDAKVEAGPSGFHLGIPRFKKHYYILFDAYGNADLILTTDKPAGVRLDLHAKALDYSRVEAIQAGAGAPTFGRNDATKLEQKLGVALNQIPTLLQRAPALPAGAPLSPQSLMASTKPLATGPNIVGLAKQTGPRFALVIGNANYGAPLGNLANPLNDTRLLSRTLRAAGFTVVEVSNADQKAMKRTIQSFGDQLARAGKDATGLFYYAGHGAQSRGTNYLVPIGAAISSEADIDIEAVSADAIIRQMEQAGTSINIVILDACRNLPVQRLYRDGSRGLARMDAPNGSFIAYSTAPGSTAQDGTGTNSPFALALSEEMARPGQLIEETFRNVRRSVLASTAGKQTPWDSSSLVDSFSFLPAQ